MCGRFALSLVAADLPDTLGIVAPEGYRPRWNITPDSPILIVRHGPAGRVGALAVGGRGRRVLQRPQRAGGGGPADRGLLADRGRATPPAVRPAALRPCRCRPSAWRSPPTAPSRHAPAPGRGHRADACRAVSIRSPPRSRLGTRSGRSPARWCSMRRAPPPHAGVRTAISRYRAWPRNCAPKSRSALNVPANTATPARSSVGPT